MKIVATNVVASRPPERRPTATPTARANIYNYNNYNCNKNINNNNNFPTFWIIFLVDTP